MAAGDIAIQVIVREWALEGASLVSFCMLLMWGAYLIRRLRSGAYDATTRGIIAISAFVLGGFMRGSWVSGLLWDYTHSGNVERIASYWSVDVVAGIVTVIGGLCVIREFASDGWGDMLAVIAAIFSAAMLIGAHVFF